jgi:hypothetical protein
MTTESESESNRSYDPKNMGEVSMQEQDSESVP